MRLLIGFLLAVLATPAIAQDVKRSIVPVTGDVYLMRNNFHNSLLVATTEGVVRVDPINAEAGVWLNSNLGQIGQDSVSHLIYSHSHGDHASGGGAHEGAIVIAHEDAPAAIDGVSPDLRVGDTHTMEIGGKTTVFAAGKRFQVLATNDLAERIFASPALSGKVLYLRTEHQLYRLEE